MSEVKDIRTLTPRDEGSLIPHGICYTESDKAIYVRSKWTNNRFWRIIIPKEDKAPTIDEVNFDD